MASRKHKHETNQASSSQPKRRKYAEQAIILPANLPNPFYEPFCNSDIVLVLAKGQKLHVHESVLSVYSPVFLELFSSAEEDTTEFKLKDEVPDYMIAFLKLLYPQHSAEKITDDEELERMLELADRYDVQHVRVKCAEYIQSRITGQPNMHNLQKLSYLATCDKYRLSALQSVMKEVAKMTLYEISSQAYDSLRPETKVQVLEARCGVAERMYNAERSKVDKLESKLTRSVDPKAGKCSQCKAGVDKKVVVCTDCIEKIFTEVRK